MQIGDKAPDLPTFGDKTPDMRSCNFSSEVIAIYPEQGFYRAKFTFHPSEMTFVESFWLGRRRGNA